MDDHTYGNTYEARHHWDGKQRIGAIGAKTADFDHDGHLAVRESQKKRVYKAAVASLCVLCLLLLTGLLVLVYTFTKIQSAWEGEMTLLDSRFNNLTRDNSWLQVSYHNLSVKRDQLQASYNDMTVKRDQLQASYNDMTVERDQLRASYYAVTFVKDQLWTSYNKASAERDQMRESYKKASAERDQMRARLRELERLADQEGWQYFRGSIYLVSSVNKTWQESRKECQRMNSDLLIINTQEEQAFANQFQRPLWIGLTDLESEGTWTWVDGTAPYKSYWDVREPNGRDRENCCEIKTYQLENSWNDLDCNARRFWICEQKMFP